MDGGGVTKGLGVGDDLERKTPHPNLSPRRGIKSGAARRRFTQHTVALSCGEGQTAD